MRAVHWLLRASLGLWGLALAIGAMPGLQRKAAPDDLPGALPAAGLASSGPVLQFAIAILLPFLTILAAQRVIPLLAERRWAAWTFSALLATAPITLMHYGTLRHVVMHGLAAAGIVFARRLEPRFSRADVLLIPCVLNFYFAFLDTKFGRTPAATFFRAAIVLLALRLLIGVLSKQRRPGVAFALAPAAFIFQMHWLEPNVAGIVALIWLMATSIALAKLDERNVMRIASWSALPLAAAAFPLALIGAASLPPLDFFEDGHSLLPASEMARGELPYRDIIPMHGLLSDGVLDLWAMNAIRPDLGAILTSRRVLAALTAVAIYCTALAVTTSAELALLATFLSLAIFPAASLWPRAVLPLFALAAAAAGTRLRNRKLFAVAGALVVLSALFSLDLALCSGVISLLAALRMRAFVPWMIGVLAIKLPLLVVIAIAGFLPSFITTTLFEVLGNGGVYVIGTLDLPHGLRTLAEIAGAVAHPETFAMLMWFVALIGASAVLAKSPWKGSRRDAVWLVAGWIVLAGAAWVLRRHHYFAFPLAAFLMGAIVALRHRSRPAAIALTIALAFFAKPFALVFDLSSPLRRSGGLDVEGWQEYKPLPRARGAVVDPLTHKGLGAAQRFLATLKPNETFYDFANAATLYFLFNRDCPIRQVEVAMYESEEAQRNVIATLERNRNVIAALMIFPTAYSNIDSVSNRDRAPLVAKYLEQHFEPAFDEEGVVFWTRKKR